MAMPSSSPPDPTPTTNSSSATSATVSAARPIFVNPAPQPTNPRLTAPPPICQPLHHNSAAFPPASHTRYTPQTLPNIAPRQPAASNHIHSQLPGKVHDHAPPQGILYPVASSGRGFLRKPIRPQPSDQAVTIANPGAFPPRSLVSGYAHPHSHLVRPFGFAHPDASQGQPTQLVRPNQLQHSLIGSNPGVMAGMVKGIPVPLLPKVAAPPSSTTESNGYKDLRDRSRDDNFTTFRGRKVRISEGASLYSLCRSWLTDGLSEESQAQYMDGVRSLPRPLPMPLADAHLPAKKEEIKEEDDEKNVGHLSPKELMQRHIKQSKRVRARLREQRLQRIARYKTRLALLLPPLVEQQFRNDTPA